MIRRTQFDHETENKELQQLDANYSNDMLSRSFHKWIFQSHLPRCIFLLIIIIIFFHLIFLAIYIYEATRRFLILYPGARLHRTHMPNHKFFTRRRRRRVVSRGNNYKISRTNQKTKKQTEFLFRFGFIIQTISPCAYFLFYFIFCGDLNDTLF